MREMDDAGVGEFFKNLESKFGSGGWVLFLVDDHSTGSKFEVLNGGRMRIVSRLIPITIMTSDDYRDLCRIYKVCILVVAYGVSDGKFYVCPYEGRTGWALTSDMEQVVFDNSIKHIHGMLWGE